MVVVGSLVKSTSVGRSLAERNGDGLEEKAEKTVEKS